ncbi:MAG: hypothetical protein QOD99_2501 [Chthoniobacter sp.]|nr:hypothetical protein [Chthoniobacter sp.]
MGVQGSPRPLFAVGIVNNGNLRQAQDDSSSSALAVHRQLQMSSEWGSSGSSFLFLPGDQTRGFFGSETSMRYGLPHGSYHRPFAKPFFGTLGFFTGSTSTKTILRGLSPSKARSIAACFPLGGISYSTWYDFTAAEIVDTSFLACVLRAALGSLPPGNSIPIRIETTNRTPRIPGSHFSRTRNSFSDVIKSRFRSALAQYNASRPSAPSLATRIRRR